MSVKFVLIYCPHPVHGQPRSYSQVDYIPIWRGFGTRVVCTSNWYRCTFFLAMKFFYYFLFFGGIFLFFLRTMKLSLWWVSGKIFFIMFGHTRWKPEILLSFRHEKIFSCEFSKNICIGLRWILSVSVDLNPKVLTLFYQFEKILHLEEGLVEARLELV